MRTTILAIAMLALPAFAGGPFATPAACSKVVELAPILLDGWENYGPPFPAVSAYKDCMGRVHIRGGVRNGGGGTAFVLPEGFRPDGHEIFVAATSAYRPATVYVTVDGQVTIIGDKNFVSLSGISYRVAP